MNLKQLYQKLTILPALIVLTYICLFIDTIKYPGAVGTHFFIDAKVYFALSVTVLLFLKTRTKVMEFVLKVNRILLILFTFIYIFFILLEGSHFTNYVLNVFHIHLDGLVLVVLFSLSVFLVDKFKNAIPRLTKRNGLIYIGMVFFIVFYVIKNTSLVFDMAFNTDSYILFHLTDTYDEKMFYEWGKAYQFLVFVRNNTPSDATVIIPPEEDPWLMGSGNDTFVRAFIFPRKITQETLIIPDGDIKSFAPKTYILITWGKEQCNPNPECHGWPRQNIVATRIIYKDDVSERVAEVKEHTVYKLKDSQYVYGIIEI